MEASMMMKRFSTGVLDKSGSPILEKSLMIDLQDNIYRVFFSHRTQKYMVQCLSGGAKEAVPLTKQVVDMLMLVNYTDWQKAINE